MIGKIGCRAHDYGRDTIEALCGKITADGYRTTQLALKKALVESSDMDRMLTEEFVTYLAGHLKKHALEVSVFGAYLNYAHPDEDAREGMLQLLRSHLMVAADLGCRMVGTETGSLDASYAPHPDNHGEEAYQRFMTAIQSVMPLTTEYHTHMAVEAVAHHIIHTPERMKRLADDIGHDRLKVIFDITNIITWENRHKQDDLINQMFDLLEDRIWAVHIKDYVFIDGVKHIVPIGQGEMNLDLLMARVKKSRQKVDVLAENIELDQLAATNRILGKYLRA